MRALFGLFFCVMAASAAGRAAAQPALCGALWREIASIERGGASPARAAQHGQQALRTRAEMGQLQGAMQAEGCEQRGAMFNAPPSPQCLGYRQRFRQLAGQLQAAEAAMREADGDPQILETRRRQLYAMLGQSGCQQPDQPRPRGPLEALFGGGQQPPMPGRSIPSIIEILPDGSMPGFGLRADPYGIDAPYQPRDASLRAVCVRSCDGYFFPLDISAFRAREDGETLCKSLCPGTKTSVYFMPRNGDIEQAVNADGENYTALPNAARYKQVYEPGCACKARTESWANALKGADQVFERLQEDSGAAAPPALSPQPRAAAKPGAKPPAATAAPLPAQLPADAKIVGAGEGAAQEATASDGSRRTIRNVAPELAPPKPPGLRLN